MSACSVLGLLTFILFMFTDGKKQNATLRDYGMTSEGSAGVDWKLIGRSLLLAVVVLYMGFAYLRLGIITITVVVFIQLYIQKHVMFRTGTAMKSWSADLTRLWGMPAGVAVGTFGNTYLYRKSGSIWPGVFLMGTLCALACVLHGAHGLFG